MAESVARAKPAHVYTERCVRGACVGMQTRPKQLVRWKRIAHHLACVMLLTSEACTAVTITVPHKELVA